MIYGLGLWCKAWSTAGCVRKVLPFKGKKRRGRAGGVWLRLLVQAWSPPRLPKRSREGSAQGGGSSSDMGCTHDMRVGQAATSPYCQTGHKTKLWTQSTSYIVRCGECSVDSWLQMMWDEGYVGFFSIKFWRLVLHSYSRQTLKMENRILSKIHPMSVSGQQFEF